jgi:hypothetical protein
MKFALLLLCAGTALAEVVTLKDGGQVIGDIASGTTREVRIKVDNVEQAIAVDRILSIEFGAVISKTITLPADTEIKIRTDEEINSKTVDEQREYAASLADAVVLNGVTALPAHTRAFFRATDIVKPKIHPASFRLSLVAVMVSGQKIPVETGKLESIGDSPGKGMGKGALIGGVTGAVFGLMVAGPQGSLVMASVGAVGGAFVSKLLQKGEDSARDPIHL